MASTFRLKRKLFGEYGVNALNALREGKAAGLTGKELQDWVKINSGSTYATNSGIKSIGGIQSRPATDFVNVTNNDINRRIGKNVNTNWQVTAPKNTYTAATPSTGVTTGGNMVSLTGNTNYNYGKKYKGGVSKAANRVTNTQKTLINKGVYGNNSATISNIGKKSIKPLNSVNKGGTATSKRLVNSWSRMGTVGKVGTAAAVVGTGYLAGKGLGLWGNSDKK